MSFEALVEKCRKSAAWKWSYEEIQHKVNKIRAGRSLQPRNWPNNAKVAVLFSVDIDNETAPIVEEADNLTLEGIQYSSRRGLGRIVDTLDHNEIPATFFTPAVSLQLTPEIKNILKKSGHHEVGVHGWIHEPLSTMTREQQRSLIKMSQDYLEEAMGQKPVGFRAPYGDITECMIPILKELGFLYDSSLNADESPYEAISNGEPSGMIVLPPAIDLEDSLLFPYNGVTSGIISPREVLQIYKDTFDTIYEEGSMMLFIMHPHVTGRASRIGVLKQIIEYMKQKGDVWFATHKQAAEYVAGEFDLELDR
jgi:peptidoglycan-N-acetylglucosamine deacetylase